MKKYLTIAMCFCLLSCLFMGCGQKKPMPAAPTEPMITIKPTEPVKATEPRTEPTEDTAFQDTVSPVHTVPEEALTEATIEDGNGPIPSQELPAETK